MIQKQCKYCDKKIEGYTEHQVDYMMKQHIIAKHPDKKIEGIKKDGSKKP